VPRVPEPILAGHDRIKGYYPSIQHHSGEVENRDGATPTDVERQTIGPRVLQRDQVGPSYIPHIHVVASLETIFVADRGKPGPDAQGEAPRNPE